ncbi:hypothetical protein GF359_03175 [candidate division WOR-3 bacterium]|uniref:Uncharacterized protein n=1 Tax=candidate division WOR-3 bacterium TaxID=2052148 RepID=A0A9D5QCM2_UNCW3|nr:hypothetical protein [candidate division WOR-3 bacterium]MBD3364197.1 hypothetical protein [candidate division WOR-3 bacterium]
MKFNRIFTVALLATVLISSPVSAQEIYRPISVTFIYPLSTNGFSSGQVASNFSFNILGGYIGSVKGFELGGIFNIEKNHVAGLQIGGVANLVGENVAGLEFGGVANVAGKNCVGLQVAGVGNFVGKNLNIGQVSGVLNTALGSVSGFQLGGVANIAGGEATGLQIAGVANITARDVIGAQVSGTLNIARGSCPAQIGVVNIALGQTFTQIGVVNIAGYARGLQLGVVNIARDHSGVPVGLASVVKNGQFHVNFWTDETAVLNAGIKFGSQAFYNVWTYGYQPFGARSKFGIGLGGHIPAPGPLFVDIDAVHYQFEDGIWPFISQNSYNGLTTVRFTGGIKITPKLAFTAGPTVNVWHSQEWDGDAVRYFGIPVGDYDARNYTDIWLGFQVGVQIL